MPPPGAPGSPVVAFDIAAVGRPGRARVVEAVETRRGLSSGDRQAAERHDPARPDLEHAIDPVRVDRRRRCALARDRQVAEDVEVAAGVRILTGRGDAEREVAARDADRVGAAAGGAIAAGPGRVCVGGADRLPQRAVAVGVELVRGSIHVDRRAERGSGTQREAECRRQKSRPARREVPPRKRNSSRRRADRAHNRLFSAGASVTAERRMASLLLPPSPDKRAPGPLPTDYCVSRPNFSRMRP